jgi:hypothetical protein
MTTFAHTNRAILKLMLSFICQLVLNYWIGSWSFAQHQWGYDPFKSIVTFMSTGAWSIEIWPWSLPMLIQWLRSFKIHRQFHVNWCLVHWNWLHILAQHVNQWGYDPSNPSSLSCQLEAWSIEIDHDPSPMLVNEAAILQTIVNFMSTGAWSIEIDHDPRPC